VLTWGTIRSIGSLLVILRLWRLAKLYEEIVLSAAERIDSLEQRNQELSDEVKGLREQLDLTHTTDM
jgi:voltage-gated hydrogen channel 1